VIFHTISHPQIVLPAFLTTGKGCKAAHSPWKSLIQPTVQALESATPKKGARVLVLNASGRVGVFAVQLAKVVYDAYEVGVTGPDNVAFVKVT